MAVVEDLRDWQGKDVLAAGGEKVGKLYDVYFDVESDLPIFLVVDTGRRGPSILVPAWNATTSPDHVAVPYERAAVEAAPTVNPVRGLSVEDEGPLFAYYQVQHQPSQTGTGRRLMRR